MDGSVDELFYSSLWSDLDVNQRSLLVCGESGEANRPIISLVGLGEDNNNDSPTSMTNSVHKPDSLATQDASSIVLCSESDLTLEESFRSPSNGMVNSGLEVGNVALQYNLAIPTPFYENGDEMRSSLLPYINVEHSSCNYGFETSSFDKDLQTFSPIRQSCPLPCFECVTSVSPHFEKQQINRGLVQEEYVENDLHVSESKHFNFSASVPSKGKQDLRNCALSSFASAPQLMGMTELQSLPQTKSNICFKECNGAGKPRVRARRGQATDPHSIAERLRREKIAERMRTLQELVPSSCKNKMDKASVLDDIIEYVKFLQLQLKAPKGLSLPSSSRQAANVLALDEIAFKQEVVKLMESDMTLAMQYLQGKGICLMPVDLAAEISRENESLSSLVCEDWKSNIAFTKERFFSQ